MRTENFIYSSGLQTVITQTCQSAATAFNADHCAVVAFSLDFTEGEVAAEYPFWGANKQVIPVRGVPEEERLISEKRPLFFARVEQVEGLGPVRTVLKQLGICTILIIPILVDESVVGSFSLDFREEHPPFTEHELNQCKGYAAQVALAWKSAKRVNRLDLVWQTILELTSRTSPHSDPLKLMVEGAIRLLDARSGGIYRYRPAEEDLPLVAWQPQIENQQFPKITLKLGEGAAGKLVKNNLPFLIIDDYAHWPERSSSFEGLNPFGAVVEVPLKRKHEMLGVLYIDDKVGRKFTTDDAMILSLLADHAAFALNTEGMHENSADKLHQLENIVRYSAQILGDLSSLELDDRLDLIARYVTQIIQSETCGIFLYTAKDRLRLEASYGHRPGHFEKGRTITVQSGVKTGLTGHIAALGEPFNEWGEALNNHPAVKGHGVHTPSGVCYSLLMIPMNKHIGETYERVGWIRVDNKKDDAGQAGPNSHFSPSDLWILSLFAEIVSAPIDAARFVTELDAKRNYQEWLVENWREASAASTEDALVQSFAERVRQRLQADILAVWFYDQETERFTTGTLTGSFLTDEQRSEFQKLRPRAEGTARYLLDLNDGWVGVENMAGNLPVNTETRSFLSRLGVMSFQGVVLKAQDSVIGVMYADYRVQRSFSGADKVPFLALSEHLSLTLSLALKRIRIEKKHDLLTRTQEAVRAIAHESLTLEPPKIAIKIAEQILQALFCGAVACYPYDSETDELYLPPGAVGYLYPEQVLNKLELAQNSVVRHVLYDMEDLRDNAYETHNAQEDKWLKSDFVAAEKFITTICYRLRVADRTVGALFINYRDNHAFTRDERGVIASFADLAAVAIDNAWRAKRQLKGQLQINHAMLQRWLSMISSAYSHEVDKRVTTIAFEVNGLRTLIDAGDRETAHQRLNQIDQVLGLMKDERLTLPLASESGVEPVLLYDLLRERLNQLFISGREPYKSIKLIQKFTLPKDTAVRVSPDWMKYVIDILVDRATTVMKHARVKNLTVSAWADSRNAYITFADSGKEIASDIQLSLFREILPEKSGVKGAGINEMIARAIVQTYNGDIQIEAADASSTTIKITLPLEQLATEKSS